MIRDLKSHQVARETAVSCRVKVLQVETPLTFDFAGNGRVNDCVASLEISRSVLIKTKKKFGLTKRSYLPKINKSVLI